MVVGGNGKGDCARSINLRCFDRDVSGHVQRAVTTNVAVPRRQVERADALQRQVANVDQTAGNIQNTGPILRSKVKRLTEDEKRIWWLLRCKRRTESSSDGNVRRA